MASYSQSTEILRSRLDSLRKRKATLLELIHEINGEISGILFALELKDNESASDIKGISNGAVSEQSDSSYDPFKQRTVSEELTEIVESKVAAEKEFWLERTRRLSTSAPAYIPNEKVLAEIEEKHEHDHEQL